jgi:hypothetical protein
MMETNGRQSGDAATGPAQNAQNSEHLALTLAVADELNDDANAAD